MATQSFDWRALATSDEELQKLDPTGTRYGADGSEPGEWKQGLIAAYLKEDYLSKTAKRRGLGLIDLATTPLTVAWNVVFGFPKSERIDYTIGPEEAALVIRDGKALGTYNQARLKTGGTFLDWLKDKTGERPNFRMLIADCAPFTLDIGFGADGAQTLLTRDSLVMMGKASLRLQVDPAHLENLLGMFHGRSLLHREDFAREVADLLFARVLVPQVKTHTAEEIRGNVGFQDKLRTEAMREIEDAYKTVGILVENATFAFALTDRERADIAEASATLVEEGEVREHERAIRKEERTSELESAKRELEDNAHHQAEMRALLQARETQIASATNDLDRQKAQLELRKVQLELDALEMDHQRMQQRLTRLQEIELEEKDTLSALNLKQRKREIEREDEHLRAQSDHERRMEVARLDRETKERLLDRYRDLTPDQLLAIQAAESEAVADALAQKFRAEAEKASDAAERTQQMAREHADRMGRVAEAAASAGKPAGIPCPRCGAALQPGWKVCPHCATKVHV